MFDQIINSIGTWVASFGLPDGDFYRHFYGLLPLWLLATAAGVFFLWKMRGPLSPGWAWLAPKPASSTREIFILAAFCALLVALADGRGFFHGFFRQDDFSFLQVPRELPGVWKQMFLYHNDHPYPLYRIQVWTFLHLAGPDADANTLSHWFSAFSFLVHTCVLWAGCWFLHEAGARRLTLGLFAFVAWVWPGWGEFTSGFFTLSVYNQVLVMGLCAAAATLRGIRHHSIPWQILGLGLALFACGLNISGMWTIAAVGFTAAAARWPLRGKGILHLAAVLFLFAVACWYFLVAFKHPFSARELVQNPSALTLDQKFSTSSDPRILQSVSALVLGMGGIFLSLPMPVFLQFMGEKIAAIPLLKGAFLVVHSGIAAAILCWLYRKRMHFSKPDLLLLSSITLTAATGIGLVIVARKDYALSIPTSLWHAKYMAMPYTWAAIGAALAVERVWIGQSLSLQKISRYAGLVLAAGLWLFLSHELWEKTLLNQPLSYVARGRWGNIYNSILRHQYYDEVMRDLSSLLSENNPKEVLLPEPVWGGTFFSRYTLLEWGSDYTPRGVTHLFADMPAASPRLDLHVKFEPLDSIPPGLILKMQDVPWLKDAVENHYPKRKP